MKIFYSLEGKKIKKGSGADDLILKLAREVSKADMPFLKVVRPQGKKPYIEGADFSFSLSHSGDFWCICFSEKECGIDVQRAVPARIKEISKRFFKLEEYNKVVSDGNEAFFRIWTGKEAVAKYLGQSIFKENINLLKNDEYYNIVNVDDCDVYIYFKKITNGNDQYYLTLVAEDGGLSLDNIMEELV